MAKINKLEQLSTQAMRGVLKTNPEIERVGQRVKELLLGEDLLINPSSLLKCVLVTLPVDTGKESDIKRITDILKSNGASHDAQGNLRLDNVRIDVSINVLGKVF